MNADSFTTVSGRNWQHLRATCFLTRKNWSRYMIRPEDLDDEHVKLEVLLHGFRLYPTARIWR